MMGLYDDVGYNDDAYKLTLQGETYEERLEIDKKEIARKVREMGPAGLAAHAAKKLIFTFGEGMYHAPIKLDLGAVHQNPLQMYFIQGKQHLGRTGLCHPCRAACAAGRLVHGRRPCGTLSGTWGNSGAGGRVWAAAVFAFVGDAQPLPDEFFARAFAAGLPRHACAR